MMMVAAATARLYAAGICPQAPPGMQQYQDQITSWVKWGVLGLIVVAALVSIGSILIGRIFSHPHASRYGAMGLGITVICAILYVTVLGILAGITGTGC
jgi:bacteriorhodopsin